MTTPVHLIKLSVGSESVEQIASWQKSRSGQRKDGRYYHLTRMFPKRTKEILAGGSIYWVVQGLIQARQRVERFEEMIGSDGIRRCAIFLDPELIRTEAAPRRPFQGWRYLNPEDAPRDLTPDAPSDDDLPTDLRIALAEIGVR
ncbi:DUF1489 family protein [Palleronia caenipelagi]|uniref:DUF1489 family protein n=1 Tax=Palleronia caenipelagi TaxID=2489174 RepID=A0A547PMQ1_9RHOB|nr:DUF1489 domain-containing protein [Palleronia caenipelagi]TRD15294.1 DUF1489 family protein [Palleronia caenipelagi]